MLGNCTSVPANPDVAGIGLRISIYSQALVTLLYPILALVVTRGRQPSRVVERVLRYSLVVTGCGVLISAIARARHQQLTIFHALVVLNLSWIVALAAHSSAMAGFCARHVANSNVEPKMKEGYRLLTDASSVISIMKKKMPPGKNRSGEKKKGDDAVLPWGFTGMFHLTLTSAMGIWAFTDSSHFPRPLPNTDTCASYLFFGHSIPLQSPHLRTFWLAVCTLGFLPFFNSIFLACALLPLNFAISVLGAMLYACCYSCAGTSDEDGGRRTRTYAPRLGELGAALLLACAIAASTEGMLLFVASNDGDGQGKGAVQWTLGEIFALFLIVPGLVVAGRDMWKGARGQPTEEEEAVELLEQAESGSEDSEEDDNASVPRSPDSATSRQYLTA